MTDNDEQEHLRSTLPFVLLIVLTLLLFSVLPAEVTIFLFVILVVATGVAAYRLGNYLLSIISVALLFRIAIVVGDTMFAILPVPPISSGHDQRAIELMTAWLNAQFLGALPNADPMRLLMAHLLTPFYVIFGPSPISGRIGIALISMGIGFIIYHLAKRVASRRTSLVAAFVVLFWPPIVYRSVVIQREIVITVALLAFLWAALRWLDVVTLKSVLVAILSTIAMFAMRKENLFLIAMVLGVVFLLKGRKQPKYLGLAAFLTIPFIAYFIRNFETFTGFGSSLTPSALDAFAYGRAHGNTAYLLGLHYNSWLDVVLYAPIKVVYFLFTPFPWQIRGPVEFVVGVSALTLLMLTVLSRRGIGLHSSHPDYLLVLLSYLVTGVVTYSIIEMNYGAAVRRRIQFVPIIILLGVIGLSNVRVKIRGFRGGSDTDWEQQNPTDS